MGRQSYRFPGRHKPLIFLNRTVMLGRRMSQNRNSWLIADVGATTSRCATLADGEVTAIHVVQNDRYRNLPELLREYRDQADLDLASCALAVAAPIDGDVVQMCNRDWRFDRQTIADLGFGSVELLNDFHAIGWALPRFDDATREEIGAATHYRDGNIAVLGPGSGLGMSAWISGSVMSGEGGHITVSGRDAGEDEIIARLRDRFGHCSAERVLSGPGLLALYEAIHGERPDRPEDITANPDEPRAAATLQQFFRFLGSAAAELALITGAYGGVYIAGGIVPAMIESLKASEFRSRFEDKNRYRDYMRAIPTWVITDPYPGLTGLKAYVDQGLRRP
jgi:glucokinase